MSKDEQERTKKKTRKIKGKKETWEYRYKG